MIALSNSIHLYARPDKKEYDVTTSLERCPCKGFLLICTVYNNLAGIYDILSHDRVRTIIYSCREKRKEVCSTATYFRRERLLSISHGGTQ